MSGYLFVSTAVTDLITLPDGYTHPPLLGGAGLYALVGAKVWADDVTIITGIGNDFLPEHGAWFRVNALPTDGLRVVCAHSPRNAISYFADGEREERPVFGAQHYRQIVPTAEDVARHCRDARGVYVFRDLEREFWGRMSQLRDRYGLRLMWEISAEVAVPEHLDAIKEILRDVDFFSLNRVEALRLFAAGSIEAAVAELQALNRPLAYLRLGAKGAAMIEGDRVRHIPAIANGRVVDPTGAGNSSSGAVLVGLCEGQDALTAGVMGAISAAYAIAQYGPPPALDASLRREATGRLNQVLSRRQEAAQ